MRANRHAAPYQNCGARAAVAAPGSYRFATTALVTVLLLAAWSSTISAEQTGADRAAIVIPFDNSPAEPRLFWMGEGSAVLVSELLAALGRSVVPREERLRAFERLQLPPAAALSHATVIKIGQLVRASDVVIGSYALAGERLQVKLRLIALDSGQMLPEVAESGELTDMLEVFSRAVRRLANLPGEGMPDAGPLLQSPAGFEAYVKGMLAETPATQLAFFEQAMKAAPDDRVRLAFGSALLEQGRHADALDVLAAVPRASRWSREARYASGLVQLSAKRFDDAFATFSALADEVRSAVILNALGVVQLRRGGTHPAGRPVYFFSQATQLDQGDPDFFFNLGYGYWLDRDPQAAIYWLREAVRRDPADADAHEVLGRALQTAGSTAEAARERELAQRLAGAPQASGREPATAAAKPVAGLERMRDRLEPTSARVDAVLSASGQRDHEALARFHLETAHRAFGREADREAEQELRRALYLSPYLADAHLLLGRVYLRNGRPTDAIDALKIALWSNASVDAHLALAEAFLQVKDPGSARTEVDRALALDPSSEPAQRLRERVERAASSGAAC